MPVSIHALHTGRGVSAAPLSSKFGSEKARQDSGLGLCRFLGKNWHFFLLKLFPSPLGSGIPNTRKNPAVQSVEYEGFAPPQTQGVTSPTLHRITP